MWGHNPACTCGVCPSIRRLHRVVDEGTRFSPTPFLSYATVRVRNVVGELEDWITTDGRRTGRWHRPRLLVVRLWVEFTEEEETLDSEHIHPRGLYRRETGITGNFQGIRGISKNKEERARRGEIQPEHQSQGEGWPSRSSSGQCKRG